ncbi:DgyrCDS14427 [Dimorphilus gyrociliatus]|uniref:DgyrCDS14427 n=1 Tax=Dimorphilus gyrociliatus TaxID=2664684 RepID=A0A7I8WDJ6_9ANNE|nr:DgyrCDS14427 [Dimorphilus gyrociliatus]
MFYSSFSQIWCLIPVFLLKTAIGTAIGEKLLNIADLSMNSSCTAESTRPSTDLFTFECENALSPQWININPWISNCSPSCYKEKYSLTFKKEYDICEICLSQPFFNDENKVKQVEFCFNGQQSMNVKLDMEKNIECYLPKLNYGKNVQTMTFIIGHRYKNRNTGLSSIVIYAYDNDTSENMTSADYFTDVSSTANGATCTAKSQLSENWNCRLALDFQSYLFFKNKQEWVADCTGSDCIGQYINITFEKYGKPTIYCLTNKQSSKMYIIKVMEKWTSGLIKLQDLKPNQKQQCFEYNEEFIETGLYLESREIQANKNIGFAQVQVFVKELFARDYTLAGTSTYAYKLPSYIHNKFKSFSFQLFKRNSSFSDDCGDIIISFYSNMDVVFKIFISNLLKSYIEIVTPNFIVKAMEVDKFFILCNETNDFWISMSNDTIQFGKGLLYNVNTILTTQFKVNRITEVSWKSKESSFKNSIKINDIDGRNVFIHNRESCSKVPSQYLTDRLVSTCVALPNKSTIIETINLNGIPINRHSIKTKPEIVLKFDKHLFNFIHVQVGYKNSYKEHDVMFCTLKIAAISNNNYHRFVFTCDQLNSTITNLYFMISTTATQLSSVEICHVNP